MLDFIGGAERDRTAGLLVANEALSQLSYSPTKEEQLFLVYQRVGNSQIAASFPRKLSLQMIHVQQELRIVAHLLQAAHKQFHCFHR